MSALPSRHKQNVYMAIDWLCISISMLQVSIAECWLGRFEKQRKCHAERDSRQRKIIRLDADLFVRAAGQSGRGRYPYFTHWVILLCVLRGQAAEMHYVSFVLALPQEDESLDEWGGERRREMNGFARAQSGETGGQCGLLSVNLDR